MNTRPDYLGVFLVFAKNSLIREISFRLNFLVECFTSLTWMGMNLGFYLIVFDVTKQLGASTGWGRWEFFVFLGTTMVINSIVQTFFMPNCEEFSEMIRTGNLDFALLKPIDTQFLVSLQKIDWSASINILAGVILLLIGVLQIGSRPVHPAPLGFDWVSLGTIALYLVFLSCGVVMMYALMISLSATSIWLGRNQSLYDFWFYITNFSRYPMEIYEGNFGTPLRYFFTYVVPILVVVNVPARTLARPLFPENSLDLSMSLLTIGATIVTFFASRMLFQAALWEYRSASS